MLHLTIIGICGFFACLVDLFVVGLCTFITAIAALL